MKKENRILKGVDCIEGGSRQDFGPLFLVILTCTFLHGLIGIAIVFYRCVFHHCKNDSVANKEKLFPHLTGESRRPPRGVRGIRSARWGITESQMSDWFGPTG